MVRRICLTLGFVIALPGLAAAQSTEMIVGGEEAEEGQFPWQVYVETYDPSRDGYSACGGSIIDKSWVLTAAHCVDAPDAKVTIFYGSINPSQGSKSEVEKIFIHDDYAGMGGYQDIALLKLSTEIDDADDYKIETANLEADKKLVTPGAKLTVSGWGNLWDFQIFDAYGEVIADYNALADNYNDLLREHQALADRYNRIVDAYNAASAGTNPRPDGEAAEPVTVGQLPDKKRHGAEALRFSHRDQLESPTNLHFVTIDSIDLAQCNNLRESNDMDPVGSDQICAADPKGARDSCYGDSGGPLVVADASREKRFLLVGIVGAGGQCGNPTTPGTYARVASFHDWIEDTMAKH